MIGCAVLRPDFTTSMSIISVITAPRAPSFGRADFLKSPYCAIMRWCLNSDLTRDPLKTELKEHLHALQPVSRARMSAVERFTVRKATQVDQKEWCVLRRAGTFLPSEKMINKLASRQSAHRRGTRGSRRVSTNMIMASSTLIWIPPY